VPNSPIARNIIIILCPFAAKERKRCSRSIIAPNRGDTHSSKLVDSLFLSRRLLIIILMSRSLKVRAVKARVEFYRPLLLLLMASPAF